VPVDYRVLAGNVADRTTPVANLRRLQGLLAALPSQSPAAALRPLVISDRAMLTLEALAAYAASGLRYLGPPDPSVGNGAVRALLSQVSAAELAAAPVAYRLQCAEDDPAWEPYHGVLRELVVAHPESGPAPPARASAGGLGPGQGAAGRPTPRDPAAKLWPEIGLFLAEP
jgi:hypothetical protein